MQFLTLALFAGSALAWRTVYETDVITVTSCAPTVTDCPAASTVTKTTSHVKPSAIASVSAHPAPHSNGTHYTAPHVAPHETAAHPSVVTVTINACPSVPAAPSSKPPAAPAPAPSVTSVVVPYPSGNAPAPVVQHSATSAPSASAVTPNSPAFTGAASAVSRSVALAGLAGLAAVLFA